MTDLQNILCMIGILLSVLLFLFYTFSRNMGEKSEETIEDPLELDYLVEAIKNRFNQILNTNLAELNLKKDEIRKREKLRIRLKKALRTCSFGNVGEKEYVKDYIKELLQYECGITRENIDLVICFGSIERLSCQDKFEILLLCYKKQYQMLAMQMLIEKYHLADGKKGTDGIYYEVGEGEIEQIYDCERPCLGFPEKLDLLAQRIYQKYKGYGIIDELRDMTIDGISGGVSGLAAVPYNFMEEIMKERPSNVRSDNRSVWIFYHGKTIHLSFLNFESQQELERICKNIYRYNHPGQLSAANGYKVNDLYDGSRVVVVRPPFAECWAFFLRKFGSTPKIDVAELITAKGSEQIIELMKWLIKGCQVIAVTGEQGCGKTTLLKSLIRFIDPSYTLRIQELVFETHLRAIYPERNIITFRETDTVSGQAALDLQKKTDGVVNILGEVASTPVACWVVQLSQVGTKMTMFTNHANTTEKLVEYFRNSLLAMGQFHDEKIAEQQVVDAIRIDIHMSKNRDGERYIERITEILPKKTEVVFEDCDLRTGIRRYLSYATQKNQYESRDLCCYEEGEYHLKQFPSEATMEQIRKNLTREEEKGLDAFLEIMQQEPSSLNEVTLEQETISSRETALSRKTALSRETISSREVASSREVISPRENTLHREDSPSSDILSSCESSSSREETIPREWKYQKMNCYPEGGIL